MAGTFKGNVTNIVVYNDNVASTIQTTGASGSAGGLIGIMSGGTVEACASAVYVNSSGNGAVAGGLVGTANTGSILASYSGGHTENGRYKPAIDPSKSYDVSAENGTAGGLVGSFTGSSESSISQSYSTCSVKGHTAGGFVGTINGSVSNSYATGFVSGDQIGAFVGTCTDTSVFDNCSFYRIINYTLDSSTGDVKYLKGVSGTGSDPEGIAAFDRDTESYHTFSPDVLYPAKPYDNGLTTFFQNRYPLKTVRQLGYGGSAGKFITTHYGDWPMPMTFFTNTPSGSPTT